MGDENSNTNNMKNRDRILDAIDRLRARKARPDYNRIFAVLFKRYAINATEAQAALEWCIANGSVLKVEYKGSISYRNAAKKYSHLKRGGGGGSRDHNTVINNNRNQIVHNNHNNNNNSSDFGNHLNHTNNRQHHHNIMSDKANRKFAELLTKAFGELVVLEPDYLEFGVPGEEIIDNILSKDSVKYTRSYAQILIQKEVENGGLIKMQNDNYLMGPQTFSPSSSTHTTSAGFRGHPSAASLHHPHKAAPSSSTPSAFTNDLEKTTCALSSPPASDRTNLMLRGSRSESNMEQRDFSNSLHDRTSGGSLQELAAVGILEGTSGQPLKIRKKPGPKPGFKRRRLEDQNKLSNSLGSLFNENRMDGGGDGTSVTVDSAGNKDEKKMENENNIINGSLRVGGRRKRAKKVFDPSDTHIPRKRGRPAGSLNKATIEKHSSRCSGDDSSRPESRTSSNGREQGGVCSVCHVQNKRGPNDRMVACRECSNKAHRSCLNGKDMMLRMYPDNTWQCPHCKTCVVCFETSDAGYLTVCYVCADAYHSWCHQPRIAEKVKPTVKWLCMNCVMPEELKIHEIESNMNASFSRKPSLLHASNENSSSSSSSSSSASSTAPPSFSGSGGNSPPSSPAPSSYQHSPQMSPTHTDNTTPPPQLSPQNEIIPTDNRHQRNLKDFENRLGNNKNNCNNSNNASNNYRRQQQQSHEENGLVRREINSLNVGRDHGDVEDVMSSRSGDEDDEEEEEREDEDEMEEQDSPTPSQQALQSQQSDDKSDGQDDENSDDDDNEEENDDEDDNDDGDDDEPLFGDDIDPSIPDASKWTADEVYEYFAQYFPEEAKVFKEQEIDGRSLLLLRRADVLTNLNLKLGPALKMYRHVVKLQVRKDDPKYYWL